MCTRSSWQNISFPPSLPAVSGPRRRQRRFWSQALSSTWPSDVSWARPKRRKSRGKLLLVLRRKMERTCSCIQETQSANQRMNVERVIGERCQACKCISCPEVSSLAARPKCIPQLLLLTLSGATARRAKQIERQPETMARELPVSKSHGYASVIHLLPSGWLFADRGNPGQMKLWLKNRYPKWVALVNGNLEV